MPEDIGEKKRIGNCLTDHYGDRERLLSNAEVVRSGALTLEPRMRFFPSQNREPQTATFILGCQAGRKPRLSTLILKRT